MRFVPVKSPEQQSAAMLHRSRALLVKQRTMLLHAIRAHLAELGIATGAGVSQVTKMVGALVRGEPLDLPDLAPTGKRRYRHWSVWADAKQQIQEFLHQRGVPHQGIVRQLALAKPLLQPWLD